MWGIILPSAHWAATRRRLTCWCLCRIVSARGLPTLREVDCTYTVVPAEGQTCEAFGQAWGLDVDRFEQLNPDVQCPDLDTGKEYCMVGTVTSSHYHHYHYFPCHHF